MINNNFFERLSDCFEKKRSLLCVGLDPHQNLADTPVKAFRFCVDVIEKTKDLALCYKINSAFFEVYGPFGMGSLQKLTNYLNYLELPFILDTKRSDIGSTAESYAQSIFETYGADATTVNPLMGYDSVKPFTNYTHRGTFILCVTSNPGMKDFLDDLYLKILDFSQKIDAHDNVGLVVAGTYPSYFKEIREKYDGWILVPGIGYQGGKLEEILKNIKNKEAPRTLLSMSRSLYSDDIQKTAQEIVNKIRTIL